MTAEIQLFPCLSTIYFAPCYFPWDLGNSAELLATVQESITKMPSAGMAEDSPADSSVGVHASLRKVGKMSRVLEGLVRGIVEKIIETHKPLARPVFKGF